MAAKRKVIEEKEVTISNSQVIVNLMKKPSEKNAGKIIGNNATAVPELIRLLKEEAKVI
jgi:electron transfer flavoprotein beta subunit